MFGIKIRDRDRMDASNHSNSTLAFSPGPHRRSHPNLQHLSLAPLTPKYPIMPSDYNAYVDPDTSRLHTSSSLSHIASMPSPGGILSYSNSRATSKTRQKKSKSNIFIQIGPSTPRGALSSQGFGGKLTDPVALGNRQRLSGDGAGPRRNESSWLLQAGMALTEGSRESKGQSWLAKRASSTSLHSPAVEEHSFFERTQPGSGRDTPNRSRGGSRDRRKGRRELAMTPAAVISPSMCPRTGMENPDISKALLNPASAHEYVALEPDWVDSQTQAEIAADLEMELAEELEDAELYSDDGDRFGGLSFEDQADEAEDEREVQKAVRARGFGVGRWVDSVVDVFLQMDDVEEDDLVVEQEALHQQGVLPSSEETKDIRQSAQSGSPGIDELASDDGMEPAPQNPKTIWEDLAWFGRLVFKTAKS